MQGKNDELNLTYEFRQSNSTTETKRNAIFSDLIDNFQINKRNLQNKAKSSNMNSTEYINRDGT